MTDENGASDNGGNGNRREDTDNVGSITPRQDGDGSWYELPEMTRREAAQALGVISAGAAVSSIAVSAIVGLSDAGLVPAGQRKLYVKGTYLVTRNGDRLTVDEALPRGEGKKRLVLPEKKKGVPLKRKKATTLLLRFTEAAYQQPTQLDWTVEGYVAYSMVCTHAGCLVSGRLDGNLYCPCHASQFEPTAGAKVVGGPAPRPLPQLPIGVSESGELLLATGPFEGTIGPK